MLVETQENTVFINSIIISNFYH